jgi:hypothetical protein
LEYSSGQSLAHRITRTRSKSTQRRSVFDITARQIKPPGGLGACQIALTIASFSSSHLQCSQHGAADSLKSGIGRYVVKANRSRIAHRSDRKNVLIFDGHEDRIVRLLDPSTEIVMRLIAQPSRQDGGVVSVISFAKLLYRPSQHDTGSGCVLWGSVSYLHPVTLASSPHPDNTHARRDAACWHLPGIADWLNVRSALEAIVPQTVDF